MSKNKYFNKESSVKQVSEEVVNDSDLTDEFVEQTQLQEVLEEVAEVIPEKVEEVKPAVNPIKVSKQEGFSPVHRVEFDLTSYAEAMGKDKAVDPTEGGKWQYSLLQIFKSILNNNDQSEFDKEWNTVLNFFKKNSDGIFNEYYMNRFSDNWIGSPNEYSLYRRLVYTVIQTADPKTRNKAIKDIDLGLVTEGLNEVAKTRLLTFYGA